MDTDPVLQQVGVDALLRLVTFKDSLVAVVAEGGTTVEGLVEAAMAEIEVRQALSQTALDLAVRYHDRLEDEGRLTGVLAAESATRLCLKELGWYEQLASILGHFEEIGGDNAAHELSWALLRISET